MKGQPTAVTTVTVDVTRQTLGVLLEVAAERRRQDEKFGIQDHDQLKWLSIEAEEFGEVGTAMYEDWHDGAGLAQVRKEWLHVAAVACAAIESLDRNGR